MKFDVDAAKQVDEMTKAKRLIKELKGKESLIMCNMDRKQKTIKKESTHKENKAYMEYQQELSRRFIEFIKEKIIEDNKENLS